MTEYDPFAHAIRAGIGGRDDLAAEFELEVEREQVRAAQAERAAEQAERRIDGSGDAGRGRDKPARQCYEDPLWGAESWPRG